MTQNYVDIRREIIRALLALNRPATAHELSATCFTQNCIDGTRREIEEAVCVEVGMMVYEGILKADSHLPYVSVSDVLTTMTMVLDAD